MKMIVLVLSWLLSLPIQAQYPTSGLSPEVRGNGRIVEATKRVAPFTEIQTHQFPATIAVEVGGTESLVSVHLADTLRPYLRIDQQQGILKLSFVDPSGKPVRISQSTIRVTIRTPQLIGFRHGSTGDVLIEGLKGEWFDLANEANGRITLRGKVTSFNVANAANGDVRAEELLTQTANVTSMAKATLRVNAQVINEINAGSAQIINVAKRAE